MKHSDVQDYPDLVAYMAQSALPDYHDTSLEGVRQLSTHMKSHLAEYHIVEDQAEVLWPSVFVSQRRVTESITELTTRSGTAFFAERYSDRIVAFHTIAKTVDSDNVMYRITRGVNGLVDRVWMPSSFLLSQKRGRLSGFKFAHDPLLTTSRSNQMELADDLVALDSHLLSDDPGYTGRGLRSATVDPINAEDDLAAIFESNLYLGRRAFDWVEMVNRIEDDIWIKSNVYANGKVISRSPSAESHLYSTRRIGDTYDERLNSMEDDYSIRWASGPSGLIRMGEPMLLGFEDTYIPDVDQFAEFVFSGTNEFNLMGIPSYHAKHRIDIEAVDLHKGDPISFEITPYWIRIFLPDGSCSNTVLRFVTNIQRFYTSSIQVTSPSGELLFHEGGR